jgi:hypothetical protein
MADQNNLTNGEEHSIGADSNTKIEDWDCQFCTKATKGDALEEERPPIWWRIGGNHSETQKSLAKKLESRPVHILIVALVLLDLTLILTDLSMSSFYPNEEEAPEAVRSASNVFAWISVGILSVFTLEQLSKFVVFGPAYFFKFWHALDAFIIIASLVLEVVLRGAAREVTSLLVIFRLWRLVRIMHSIAEEVSAEHGESIEQHHKLEKKMQQRINELEKQLQLPPSSPITLNDKNSKQNLNTITNGSDNTQPCDPQNIV